MENGAANQPEEGYRSPQQEAPTTRQVETIKKLADQLNHPVDYESLDKRKAGLLISTLIEKNKK